ncbi:uncharacterized protein THITE_2050890 [Thermothielavioides terrestris NRRL 8126]|uniref:Zn(2)-C6 fungal-type domain-containing protein n=1 Tax=Thermothielavioides terrestris (strain ATCC 38088 / NRRL 8126) TaxID=578455 RepID=G2R7N8_THETT|nr:uncharacterized protein THITE_2050890 [Thermothielavioides terrestris NRRL 8126]AEO67947.1 hypothetical protein THITE_2050890 [Thermothielavioides terrestris NRRL 8126]
MDSDDDGHSAGLSSPWLASFSTGSTSVSAASSTTGFAHTGQLSPVSNGNSVDLPCGPASSAADSSANLASPSPSPIMAAVAHSASSSVRHPPALLGRAGFGDADAADGISRDVVWDEMREAGEAGEAKEAGLEDEEAASKLSAVPKLEPLEDDDFCMGDLQEAPPGSIQTHESAPQGVLDQPKPKRPRGRPRKHPLVPNIVPNKVTKGRSKTGCLTCRKRKKKCDEAKPRCMNCEKNAVVCEGYPEKQIWKSGKERAEEARLRSRGFPSITMHPLFPGLETLEDRIFWKHYNEQLSTVLTVEGEHKNAFKELMVPVAVQHQGLMHSILSLASKHIDFDTPYGLSVLKNNTGTSLEALKERSRYHHNQARLQFYNNIEFTKRKQTPDDRSLMAARYGQMLCFLIEALVEGSTRGEHRLHLTVYRSLISTTPPGDSAFLAFIAEFFQYHIFADELIHSVVGQPGRPPPKPLPPLPDIQSPRLLGVADGLLGYLAEITAIRNTIRNRMLAQTDLVIDYYDLYPAVDIDAAIQQWMPLWPPGDSRDLVSLLYKQMMWIYLDRTVYPPSASPPPSVAPSAQSLPLGPHSSPSLSRHAPSAVNTPPLSATTSRASSPRLASSVPGPNRPNSQSDPSFPPPGPSDDPGDDDGGGESPAAARSRPGSPPPARQPPRLDPRVTLAVDESLALLELFKPSDPCQRLLLLPCFLVGTACFSPAQQRRVRAAIRTVRGYTGLRNADRVAELLEEVWRLMAAGDWVAAWDWAGVAQRMELDFIPA